MNEETALARKITPGLLLVLVIGNVLGAGVYAVTGEVAAEAGQLAWLGFIVAFAIAGLSALSLCELVTKYPGAAGVALYVQRAFRVRWLTFVVGFAVLASGLTSAATAARAFGGDYLAEFVDIKVAISGGMLLAVLAALNYWGIEESLRANLVMTVIEVAGLLLVIVAAIAIVGDGGGDLSRPISTEQTDAAVPLALLAGAAVAFFSFLGFEDTANLSEEVRRPRRSYPLALLVGLALTGVLYVSVVLVAIVAVGATALEGSTGPLLEVIRASPLGIPTRLFALIALVAVANTALANLMMGSRLLYGMSHQGLVPRGAGVGGPAAGDAVGERGGHRSCGLRPGRHRRSRRPGAHHGFAAAQRARADEPERHPSARLGGGSRPLPRTGLGALAGSDQRRGADRKSGVDGRSAGRRPRPWSCGGGRTSLRTSPGEHPPHVRMNVRRKVAAIPHPGSSGALLASQQPRAEDHPTVQWQILTTSYPASALDWRGP